MKTLRYVISDWNQDPNAVRRDPCSFSAMAKEVLPPKTATADPQKTGTQLEGEVSSLFSVGSLIRSKSGARVT
jgi:hypothetical protein